MEQLTDQAKFTRNIAMKTDMDAENVGMCKQRLIIMQI